MDLESLCNEAIVLIREVGNFISNERVKFSKESIESKGKHNYVTYVDTKAEELLVEGLQQILPSSGFITEEGTASVRNEIYNWVIDPLDGTTNFIHGSPPYAISVALMEKEEVVLGVVYEISGSECFYSYRNSGAFLNGSAIHVSKVESVSESLIATGFPYDNFDRLEPFMRSLKHFFVHTHGVRRLGSAATDLAYVACGRYDAFYEYNLNAWDVAAGAFVVKQAGGMAGDFSGGENYIFGREIVASNKRIFNEFQHKVGQIMNP
ncbi:Inositol-1-monophosphatase [subsurface metagenome]